MEELTDEDYLEDFLAIEKYFGTPELSEKIYSK